MGKIVAEDCTSAEQSADARDKFFMVASMAQDGAALNGLRAALPALDAAEAALATTLSSLFEVMPSISSCGAAEDGLIVGVMEVQGSHEKGASLSKGGVSSGRDGTAELDLESTEMLFKAARTAIVQVRAALQ